jgi:predicted dehydrogenase
MSTRRHFLQTTGSASFAAAAQGPARKLSANDKIRIALIGAGGMGTGDVMSALATGQTELAAVADVYEGRLIRAQEVWGKQVAVTRDYRETLARPDVDAVIIGAPDHWHAQMSIDAMNAGKDVYVEKPMVQKIADGHRVIETARKTGRILQVGSQRVSSILYQKAKDLIGQGAIGKVNMIEAWWDRNSALGAWQYSLPPDASPATVDWDRFLGAAPKRAFEPIRLFRWRNYQDYGTGVAGDLFVHLFSGMHYIMGLEGPERVFATGGLRFWKDGRDVPDVMLGLYDYAKSARHGAFNLALRVNFVNGGAENSGLRFVGSEGILTVGRDVGLSRTPRESEPGYTIDTFAQAERMRYATQYRARYPLQRASADAMRPQGEEKFLPPAGYSDHLDHHRNFFEAVRTRKPVVEDAAFGLRAAGPALLSNVSYFENRVVQWDAQAIKEKA